MADPPHTGGDESSTGKTLWMRKQHWKNVVDNWKLVGRSRTSIKELAGSNSGRFSPFCFRELCNLF